MTRPRLTWASLRWFWATILLVLAIGGGTLQWLGPPPPARKPEAAAPAPPPVTAPPVTAAPVVVAAAKPPEPPKPPATPPGPQSRRDRIGLIVAGIGLNQADSLFAARQLPAHTTLAFSPYAPNPGPILDVAKARQLPTLVALAVEPATFPAVDAGTKALTPAEPDAENLKLLQFMLDRVSGYVGVLSAEPEIRALRPAAIADLLDRALPSRDPPLILIHPGPARLPRAWNRPIDVVLDAQGAGAELTPRLRDLTRLAAGDSGAVGLVTIPRGDTVERLVAWAATLGDTGPRLAPIGVLAFPPLPEKPNTP